MIIEPIDTYSYFSQYINISGKILDFGSNSGNLIRSASGRISQKNYTGIDVSEIAIEAGRAAFPEATWISYNRYHPVYNSTGTATIPNLGLFDQIISYSVFSHFDLNEILYTIDELYGMLSPNGKLVFSYCNVYNQSCIEWFRNRRENCDIVSVEEVVYLVNNKVEKNIPVQVDKLVSFFKPEYLLSLLTTKGYDATSHPARNNWKQDCMVIQKI